MRLFAVFAVTLLMIAVIVAGGKISLAQNLPEGAEFMEMVMVNVNCTTASVSVISAVLSNNTALVHFPSEINMNATEWENVTEVVAGFSTADSFLFYTFNNTSEDNAEKMANALTDLINMIFGTSFGHNSTYRNNGYVNVTYVGVGVGNLTQFTESLMQDCLIPDLGGFSSTFIPMTKEMGAYVEIGGLKESGGFNWTYGVGVMYSISTSADGGEHTIDILDLLNVDSLAPSPYALAPSPLMSMYMSIVQLSITSNDTVSYVSCRPGQAQPPSQPRGWYIETQISPTILQAYFIFGGDNTPVTELSLTFSGVIIPEFAAPMHMAVLALTTTITVFIKKRFKRK